MLPMRCYFMIFFTKAYVVGTRLNCLDNKSRQFKRVVGWCEGAVYLTSPGRPTDIGLQLGKACYPCSG